MRFTVTGEWVHDRLLRVVVLLYGFFVILLWATSWMLYFDSMDLTSESVVQHFLGNEEVFRAPRSDEGMVELAHGSVFAGNQAASYAGAADDFGEDDGEDDAWG